MKIGISKNEEIYAPLNQVLPMVNPNEIVLGGWDISNTNIYESMKRA